MTVQLICINAYAKNEIFYSHVHSATNMGEAALS